MWPTGSSRDNRNELGINWVFSSALFYFHSAFRFFIEKRHLILCAFGAFSSVDLAERKWEKDKLWKKRGIVCLRFFFFFLFPLAQRFRQTFFVRVARFSQSKEQSGATTSTFYLFPFVLHGRERDEGSTFFPGAVVTYVSCLIDSSVIAVDRQRPVTRHIFFLPPPNATSKSIAPSLYFNDPWSLMTSPVRFGRLFSSPLSSPSFGKFQTAQTKPTISKSNLISHDTAVEERPMTWNVFEWRPTRQGESRSNLFICPPSCCWNIWFDVDFYSV